MSENKLENSGAADRAAHWERKFREAQTELAHVRRVCNDIDDMRQSAEMAYREVLQWWHEADPDHCGGECFRTETIRAHLRAHLPEIADRRETL